jgi:hypothetical protein
LVVQHDFRRTPQRRTTVVNEHAITRHRSKSVRSTAPPGISSGCRDFGGTPSEAMQHIRVPDHGREPPDIRAPRSQSPIPLRSSALVAARTTGSANAPTIQHHQGFGSGILGTGREVEADHTHCGSSALDESPEARDSSHCGAGDVSWLDPAGQTFHDDVRGPGPVAAGLSRTHASPRGNSR